MLVGHEKARLALIGGLYVSADAAAVGSIVLDNTKSISGAKEGKDPAIHLAGKNGGQVGALSVLFVSLPCLSQHGALFTHYNKMAATAPLLVSHPLRMHW